jgi:hypothetical protein
LALFLRFFVVLFAFWLASLGAAAVLVLGVSAPDLPAANHWPLVSLLVFTTSAFVAAFSFAPAVVVILLAESFQLRSVLVYALAGGAVGLFCGYTLGFVERAPRFQVNDPFGTNFELMTAAGIAAGLVYWLVAGRNAGAWREPPTADIAPR